MKEEERAQHGKSWAVEVEVSNRWLVTAELGGSGWRRGPYYRGDRVMPVEGRGPGSEAMQQVVRPGDWETYQLQ
jgi:hypothetical protein